MKEQSPTTESTKTLARMRIDARHSQRRQSAEREVIAAHWAFDRAERKVLKAMERRRALRRDADLKAQLAKL